MPVRSLCENLLKEMDEYAHLYFDAYKEIHDFNERLNNLRGKNEFKIPDFDHVRKILFASFLSLVDSHLYEPGEGHFESIKDNLYGYQTIDRLASSVIFLEELDKSKHLSKSFFTFRNGSSMVGDYCNKFRPTKNGFHYYVRRIIKQISSSIIATDKLQNTLESYLNESKCKSIENNSSNQKC